LELFHDLSVLHVNNETRVYKVQGRLVLTQHSVRKLMTRSR
jgi:hypothetical protein